MPFRTWFTQKKTDVDKPKKSKTRRDEEVTTEREDLGYGDENKGDDENIIIVYLSSDSPDSKVIEILNSINNNELQSVLLNMPKSAEAKEMMVSKCRAYYRGNIKEMANISEFDLTYKSTEAIEWYTKETFLYRFINKALRTEDVDVLYHFRFYIIDLCKQLEIKYIEMKSTMKEVLKLYRGLNISPDEVQNFKRNMGNLISTNGYLSTSRDRSVAYGFATKPNNRVGVVRCLFEYQVDLELVKNIVVADISQYSAFPEEAEVLVDIGASFRIELCDYDPTDDLWHVMVAATDQGAALAAEYMEYQKKKMIDANVILMFGSLLLEMGEYDKAGKYFDNILNSSAPNDEEIACLYFNFGRTHRLKENFERSITCYTKSYDLHFYTKPKRLASAGKALNGLGIVYCEIGDQDKAMECFERAMKLFNKSIRRKHVDIGGTLINMSTIQYERRQYDIALANAREAQKIFEKALPPAHPNNALTLATLANIYLALGEYDLAQKNYERALELEMIALPSDHPDIARTLHNIGLNHAHQYYMNEARDYFEKAMDTVAQSLSKEHPIIRTVDTNRNHVLHGAHKRLMFRF
ncbi:unnamed protein product [Adineta steineri]|uniref:ADP ribosyltransferase domain-containing protein n=1 Tax=Adineta steineri TaxID=433720 RepID=A0A814L113_9BILA|nr:unnamed protein product [Adineta steineri]CAF0974558.1 unnamed protein product [Adineta steineri]CAF1058507.1 unnamed protein product [Adineta steineri]